MHANKVICFNLVISLLLTYYEFQFAIFRENNMSPYGCGADYKRNAMYITSHMVLFVVFSTYSGNIYFYFLSSSFNIASIDVCLAEQPWWLKFTPFSALAYLSHIGPSYWKKKSSLDYSSWSSLSLSLPSTRIWLLH